MLIADKQTITLISGQAGVGKTTFSNICTNLMREFEFRASIHSFATELKKKAMEIGWDRRKDEKGRRLLQELGAVARRYNEDVWAELMVQNIDGFTDFIFVDDWRFTNEYNYMKQLEEKNSEMLKIHTIHIVAPNREILKGTEQYNDVSERSLDNFDENLYDFIIDNSGSIEKLHKVAKYIVSTMRKEIKEW